MGGSNVRTVVSFMILLHFRRICVRSTRVAEVVQGHGGPLPKSLDSDENLKHKHTLFRRELRFVAINALFGDLWAKKCLLGQKPAIYQTLPFCSFFQKVPFDMDFI